MRTLVQRISAASASAVAAAASIAAVSAPAQATAPEPPQPVMQPRPCEPGAFCIYDMPNAGDDGPSTVYVPGSPGSPYLGDFDNKASSAVNNSANAWCVYEGDGYNGRAMTIVPGESGNFTPTSEVRDNETSSLRPC
ncbi:peptidase inhibitor family I36 protein [Saccharopolyspora taberi]|uniref:Beta/gamma crystallin 'Greek key' domain-containing protein n=1 Tax=Saccharopolyspora taberi TaxID=60895 RepID=A0ABN3V6K6_9PSEU